MQYHPPQYFSNSLTNIGEMTANKQKKQSSSKQDSRAKSLLLLESREAQKRVTSMVVKKDQQKSRCFSLKEGAKSCFGHTKSVKVEVGKKKKATAKSKPIIVISQCQTPMLGKYSNENANQKHLTTVGDLHSQQSETCANVNLGGNNLQSNLCSLAKQTIQESTIKPPFSIKTNQKKGIFSIVAPKELRQNLDTTIDKLKSKQLTIEMLNRTIDTRLVDSKQSRKRKENGKSREDVYEVEMNFYVDKISQLQRELHEKGKALKSASIRNEETSLLAKNCKKLLRDNLRLKEELQLSFREVAALKKLLLRKHEAGT